MSETPTPRVARLKLGVNACFFLAGLATIAVGFSLPGWWILLALGMGLAISGMAFKNRRSLTSHVLAALIGTVWVLAAVVLATRVQLDDPTLAGLLRGLAFLTLFAPAIVGFTAGKHVARLFDRLDAATRQTGS
jgi:hypothetical protein